MKKLVDAIVESPVSNSKIAWLDTIDVPVFVTVGTRDWLTPARNIEGAFEHLPNATLQVFDGTHFPILEEPERIAETLTRIAQISCRPATGTVKNLKR